MDLTDKIIAVRQELCSEFPPVVLEASSLKLSAIAEFEWGEYLGGKSWQDLSATDTYRMYSLPWEIDELSYCIIFPAFLYQVFDADSDALYHYMGTHLRHVALGLLDDRQRQCVCNWICTFREFLGENIEFVGEFDPYAEAKFCSAASHLRGLGEQT